MIGHGQHVLVGEYQFDKDIFSGEFVNGKNHLDLEILGEILEFLFMANEGFSLMALKGGRHYWVTWRYSDRRQILGKKPSFVCSFLCVQSSYKRIQFFFDAKRFSNGKNYLDLKILGEILKFLFMANAGFNLMALN